MRTIKFRCYAHASKEMFYPDSEDGWEISRGEITTIPNTTLMQFTGLLDIDKNPIYEGDIVKINYKSTPQFRIQVVEWRSNSAGQGFNVRPTGNYKIIGNIYQNSELLEK